jgi:uncharacterized protein (DUF1697 family)
MSGYVAFLRAINVGGHTVKMETLRQLFESLGFSDVETFIASGNVLFRTSDQNSSALEIKIASELQNVLGYEIATFLRTGAELAEIVSYQAFPQVELEAAAAYNIAFLAAPPSEQAMQKLMALTSDIDSFAAHGREVYWLCRRIQSQSTFSNAVLEKIFGLRSTLRGVNTVQKLAARFALPGNLQTAEMFGKGNL